MVTTNGNSQPAVFLIKSKFLVLFGGGGRGWGGFREKSKSFKNGYKNIIRDFFE